MLQSAESPGAERCAQRLAMRESLLRAVDVHGRSDGWLVWQVYALAAQGALPSLEELHLCENQLSSLAPMGSAAAGDSKTADCFALLRVLNLSTNAIASWDEVMRFAKLPRCFFGRLSPQLLMLMILG